MREGGGGGGGQKKETVSQKNMGSCGNVKKDLVTLQMECKFSYSYTDYAHIFIYISLP